jgi:hypothetical protein
LPAVEVDELLEREGISDEVGSGVLQALLVFGRDRLTHVGGEAGMDKFVRGRRPPAVLRVLNIVTVGTAAGAGVNRPAVSVHDRRHLGALNP